MLKIKKNLISIGVSLLAMAGVTNTMAQSSVQLYGQVDEFVGAVKVPSGDGRAVVAGGGMSTSYWGVKGSEDLGGGVKAIFTLESFFQPQNGQYGRFSGDAFFDRNAYVGLETPYGTLTAGRLTTQLFISTILFSPFSDSFTFSPMIYHTFLGYGTFPSYPTDQGVVGDSDWNNAVGYSTPDFNGLSGGVMYGLGNTAGDNGAKKWSAQFLYFHGPFAATGVFQYVNYNYDVGDIGELARGLKSQSTGQLGMSYDLRYVKLFAQYMYVSDEARLGGWHVNTAQGGVTVPFGKGQIMASYAYSRDTGGIDQTRQTAAVGYDYPLSKRTDIYAAYMFDRFVDQSSGQTYGVGIRTKF